MRIDWDCAIKTFGALAIYGVFLAAIMTGGFIGNFIISMALFFTVAFGVLGFCIYKSCQYNKRLLQKDNGIVT